MKNKNRCFFGSFEDYINNVDGNKLLFYNNFIVNFIVNFVVGLLK